MADSSLQNRYVARAKLLNEMQDAQAQRLAAATEQPPANTNDLAKDTGKLARAWNFSPSPNPEQDFWNLHAQTLQQNLAQLGPDAKPEDIVAAHNQAETTALNAIYPYRADLVGIGSKVIDDQVATAERIKRIVDGQTADTSGSPQAAGPAPTPLVMPAPAPPPVAPAPGSAPMPQPGGLLGQ